MAAAGLAAASWGANGSVPSSLPRVTEYDSLLVSRIDAETVLLGTQHGLFRTSNGGRSWTPAGLHQEAVTSLSQVGRTIIAAGDGLLTLSADGGKTWRRLHPGGLPNEDVAALGSDHSTIYVGLRGAGLYRSSDRGETFRPVSFMVGPAIRALALTSTRIIAGDVDSGVYLSPNGREWLHTAKGMIMGACCRRRGSRAGSRGGLGDRAVERRGPLMAHRSPFTRHVRRRSGLQHLQLLCGSDDLDAMSLLRRALNAPGQRHLLVLYVVRYGLRLRAHRDRRTYLQLRNRGAHAHASCMTQRR